MQHIIDLLWFIFKSLTFSINKAYELLKKKIETETDASIQKAVTQAGEHTDLAIKGIEDNFDSIAQAKADAAVKDAKIYTDTSIGNLQKINQLGIKSRALWSVGTSDGTTLSKPLPTAAVLGFLTEGDYLIDIEVSNADGSINVENEFPIDVTSKDGVVQSIKVSTNDSLYVSVSADGTMTYTAMHKDHLLNVYTELNSLKVDKVDLTTLGLELEKMKQYVADTIHNDLAYTAV